MTSDQERLAAVLVSTGPVLLDFDGPVTNVYPRDLNLRTADLLRSEVRQTGIDIPPELERDTDPLSVLRYVGQTHDGTLITRIERILTNVEVDAVGTAPATPGGVDFLYACRDTSRPVAIVSNNARQAISQYLETLGMSDLVFAIIGRPSSRPELMKPHTHSVRSAVELLAAPAERCVLVGDSRTDVQVARLTRVRSIAYVKAPERREALEAEEPDALVDDMATLAQAVRDDRALPDLAL